MTPSTYSRGHPIHYNQDTDRWCYWDGVPIAEERPCVRCGRMSLIDGEDACLGHIPGAVSACCGHGKEPGFIQYRDGRRVRLEDE